MRSIETRDRGRLPKGLPERCRATVITAIRPTMVAALAHLVFGPALAAGYIAAHAGVGTSTTTLSFTHPRAPAPVALAARERSLHEIARRATFKGELVDAQRAMDIAVEQWGSSSSFLTAALFYSNRLGEADSARTIFREGIAKHPSDAKLMQAWGLFESKHGELHRAVRLLRRSVVLDPGLEAVLRWQRFQDAASKLPPHRSMAQRPRSRVPVPAAMTASGGGGSSSSGSSAVGERPRLSRDAGMVFAKRPPVRYTVPTKYTTLAWKGRGLEGYGEEPAKWYDDEGERQGPPANYWRQAMDERVHRNSLRALDAIVRDGMQTSEELKELESRMAIQKPLRNRKLLGTWAVLMSNATLVAKHIKGKEEEVWGETTGGFGVSTLLHVAREGERRTVEHRYGLFDEHLDEGESLKLTWTAFHQREPITAITQATASNARRTVAVEDGNEEEGAEEMIVAGVLGGVTLLNDYMYVARDRETGQLTEVLMRVRDPTPFEQ